MGYIPPIRDEQLIQYGNRISYSKDNIKPTSPIIRADFHDVLEKQQQQQSLYDWEKEEQKQMEKMNSHIVQGITGKGYFIDEVV